MPPLEVVALKVKDLESGTVFKVYPEGEKGWVTYFEGGYDSSHNLSFYIKLRNNTDSTVSANFTLYCPNYTVATITGITISAGEEWDAWAIAQIILGSLVFPVDFTVEAWISGMKTEKDVKTFTVDEGYFLWISSEQPCKVQISNAIKDQYPGKNLYIFAPDSTLSLFATPSFCHLFKNWILEWQRSGTTETKTENPVDFTLTENCSATVYFESTT